jgi:hypothetical protein
MHNKLYLQIPYGNTATIAAITTPATAATNFHRYCGRFFNTASAQTASNTVCSKCYFLIHLL